MFRKHITNSCVCWVYRFKATVDEIAVGRVCASCGVGLLLVFTVLFKCFFSGGVINCCKTFSMACLCAFTQHGEGQNGSPKHENKHNKRKKLFYSSLWALSLIASPQKQFSVLANVRFALCSSQASETILIKVEMCQFSKQRSRTRSMASTARNFVDELKRRRKRTQTTNNFLEKAKGEKLISGHFSFVPSLSLTFTPPWAMMIVCACFVWSILEYFTHATQNGRVFFLLCLVFETQKTVFFFVVFEFANIHSEVSVVRELHCGRVNGKMYKYVAYLVITN